MPYDYTNAVSDEVRDEARERLRRVEEEQGVRVLLAVESGSRAWGFPSADSDYDVRFIYVRPRDWYLSIDVERKRDVIEMPIVDHVDLSGWDIRKALQLMLKSNPPLFEWLQSPIVYREETTIPERMRALCGELFAPVSSFHHYLSMATGNYREYLRGDEVRTKKYFYVLRPLLAIRWIENRRTTPPIEFERLLDNADLDADVRREIDDLTVLKRSGAEIDRGPRIERLNAFIEAELERAAGSVAEPRPAGRHVEILNEFFRWSIEEAWSEGHQASIATDQHRGKE